MRVRRQALVFGLGLAAQTCQHAPTDAASEASGPSGELPLASGIPAPGRLLSPEEGGFEVWLPSLADEPARVVDGDNHVSYEAESPQASYEVEVIYAPGGIANPGQFLARMRESVAQSGRVVSDVDRAVDGHSGWSMRLAEVSEPRASHVRVNLVVTSKRAFLVMARATTSEVLDGPEIRQFFDSFRPRETTGLSPEVRSTDGLFEVVFPDACGPAFKRLEMVDGKVHITYVSESTGAAQCMASVVRVDPVPSDQVLDAAVDGVLAALRGATVDATEDTTIRGASRRTLRLHATVDGVELHMRADFIHGDRALYQLQYVTRDPSELDRPEVQAYFDSLRLRDGEDR